MHPILLKTQYFTIFSYGFMLAIGYGLATYITFKRESFKNMDSEHFQALIVQMLVAGVVGARLFHVFFEWHQYTNHLTHIFRLQDGGLSIFGGIIGGLLIVLWHKLYKNLDFWFFADLITPGFALALTFGRIGCFLNGCCYGIPCSYGWCIAFPGVAGGPRHPTQLYLALAHLIFFIICWHLSIRKKGGLFIRFVVWYSVSRFFIEFIRVHKSVYSDSVAFIAPLNVFQFAILIWGIPALIRLGSEYFPKKLPIVDYSEGLMKESNIVTADVKTADVKTENIETTNIETTNIEVADAELKEIKVNEKKID